MQFANGEIELTILLGTSLILLFAITIVFLISIFNKKNQLYLKEKEIIKSSYEQSILQSQIEIQEQTFNYISQEIHDNVGQILSLAKVQLNIMNESETMSKELLNDVKENISKALSDLRDISKSLSSERIRTLGLYETVAKEAENINKSGVIQIATSMEGKEREMNEQKKLILFRIIQESLQNGLKHAAASDINLLFNYREDELQVTIKDNGKGFDIDEVIKKRAGLGLLNIKTRTLLTGGTCTIESELNKGTCIKIKIPYE